MAVGSDFTAVGASADREKAMEDAQTQAALGHLLGTLGAMREQRNVEIQRDMQNKQFQAALAQRDYENKVQQQQAELAARRLDIQDKVSQGYLKLGQDQLDMQKGGGTPSQLRDREFITQRAAADADQGMFDSPDDVTKKYPVVQPEMAQALYAHSVDARQKMTDAFNFGQNAAATLNRLNDIAKEKADLESKHNVIGVRHSNDADTYNALTAEQAKLNAAKTILQSNKNYSSLVTFDPSSGTFVNSASQPRWGKPASAPAPADDSSSAPAGFSPPPAPTAPGGVSFIQPWGVQSGQPSMSFVPGQGADTFSMPTPAAAPAAGTGMPQPFYDRVNSLIAGGMDPVTAKRQALAESTQSVPAQ